MKSFRVGSFLLSELKKWVPAGVIFIDNNDTRDIQEVEFSPEHRFDTEEEANSFFRKYYLKEGYLELENK